MPKTIPESDIDAAITELNKVRKNWLNRPGVTAVDVGYKIKDRKLTDELAIRVHVKSKLPTEALAGHELFSEHDKPKKLGAFGIDVIEAEYGPSRPLAAAVEPLEPQEVAETHRRSAVDPLVGGISVGNPRVTAGTLGVIVWDRSDCQVCILSNWHVLCGSPTCTAGEDIYQPGVADGGTAADKVAELKRWRLDKDADAALAKLTGARGYSRDILGLNPIPGVVDRTLGMNVAKSGRTTGVTEGIVDGVSASVTINYGGGTVQTFHDQIHIVPRPPWPAVDYEVSMGGDSGSVWIDEATGKAVGLHFAGEMDPSPTAENAIANRLVKVAELLNFSFTPLFCRPRIKDYYRLRYAIKFILCRRYPWLCRPRIPSPPFPPGPVPPPPPPPWSPMTPTGWQSAGDYDMMPGGIENLLDEIVGVLEDADLTIEPFLTS